MINVLFPAASSATEGGAKKATDSIALQLGDIIKIISPEDALYNDKTFFIYYIDAEKIKVVNIQTYEKNQINISAGNLENTAIKAVELISRADTPSYARQNELLPDKWINIAFSGDVPVILTGQIINLVEDMIEIRLFPDKEVIYLNFGYKGLPDDIRDIQIRSEPTSGVSAVEEADEEAEADIEHPAEEEEGEQPPPEKMQYDDNAPIQPQQQQKNGRIFLDMADIKFGTEALEPVVQYMNVGEVGHRYSIEVQLADLLDDILSSIPTIDRTPSKMKDIHTLLESYKQLREKASIFDENRNVTGIRRRSPDHKPLKEWFMKLDQKLTWLIPVIKESKKYYYLESKQEFGPDEDMDPTITPLSFENTLTEMDALYQTYKTVSGTNVGALGGNGNNRVSQYYTHLNPYLIPYTSLGGGGGNGNDEKEVNCDMYALMNNNGDFTITDITNQTVPFFGQVVTTGLTKLVSKYANVGSRKQITERAMLTPNDSINITSYATLPMPYIKHSALYLPGGAMSIYDIANASSVRDKFAYYTYFSDAPVVKTTAISADGVLDYNEEHHKNKQFIHNRATLSNFAASAAAASASAAALPQSTESFIDNLIPRIRAVFHLMRPHLSHEASITYDNIINQLEPFLIYKDDIPYSVYKDIVKYIQYAQTQYNKNLVDNTRILNTIKKYKNPVAIAKTRQYPFVYDVITTQQAQTDLIDNYHLTEYIKLQKGSNVDYIFTNAEAYLAMLHADNGQYYNAIMSLQNIALMTPDAIMKLLSGDDEDEEKAVKNNKAAECKEVIVAKTYINDAELMADNNNPNIYFDAKNDTTNYSILEDYEKEITTMTSKDFMPFLISKLKSQFKLTDTNAAYMAETLINGRKRIIDGQYAVLVDGNGGESSMTYFIRKANQWSKVAQPPFNDISVSDPSILCNTQDKCLSTSSVITNKKSSIIADKCEPMQMTKLEQRAKLIKQMSAEFDDKFVKSVEQLQKTLAQRVLYCQTQLPTLHKLSLTMRTIYDLKKIKIAESVTNAETVSAVTMEVVSPFAKGLELVLNEPDFVTRQMNIIKFANHFTRKAYTHLDIGPLGQKENDNWLYCIKSNAKLMPAFLYALATVYIETPDKYTEYTDLIIAKIGKLSDDGNMWVDMYSGYPIKMISSSSEEGFDESGHKLVTRGEIEKLAGEEGNDEASTPAAALATTNTNNTKILPTDTLPLKYVKTITNYLLGSMGVTIPISQMEFIAETVIPIFESNLPNESDYNRTIKPLINMGKKVLSYEDIYNNLILYLTLGTYFIAIQTSIPPVQTRKTFPGCVRSFGGYPFDGEGNMSGINYLACILVKIKNITAPWNILPKKETLVATKIREHIDKYILPLPEVKQRMDLKAQFLESHKEFTDELVEYNVNNKWLQFLPPLIPIKLHPAAEPISAQFRTSLLSDLKSGSPATTNKILILRSKIIQYALSMQQSIQEVVNAQDAMLHKSTNDPYLENACCINSPKDGIAIQTAIEFFTDKRPSIVKDNGLIKDYALMLYDIKKYTEAPQIWCSLNDKITYAPLPVECSEKTIYNAFITFCNFRNYQPVPADLLPFCGEKSGNLQISDTLNEMIIKLKTDGRNYTYAHLLRFLQVIHRNHIIPLNTNIIDHATPIQQFMAMLPVIEQNIIDRNNTLAEDDKVRLIELLKSTLAPRIIDPADIKTSAINNFLLAQIPTMKTRITAFMKRTLPTNRPVKLVNNFMANFAGWKMDDGDNSNVFNKFENLITFIKNIIFVFPTMIKNNVMHMDERIPAHWELADKHVNDLRTMNAKYYEPLARLTALSIGRILETIPDVGRSTVALCDKSRNLFVYERTGGYLGEYFILRTFIDYIELADRPDMFVSAKRELDGVAMIDVYSNADDIGGGTLEDIMLEQNQLVYQGNRKTLCEHVGLVLYAYMEMYMRQKDMVDLTAQNIKEIVYNTQEAERKTVTDRLEQMSIEERAAENMMKQYKLGDIWGIGLQKALVEYVPKMYDKQQDFINTMIDAEARARALLSMNGDGGDVTDFDTDDFGMGMGMGMSSNRNRNRDQELDDMAYRENMMPGDDADDYEEDNDYGNNDGEAYDNE